MLAILILGLIACESVTSFKFRRVNDHRDREIENFNIEIENCKIDILNRQKENNIRREENLNNEIKNINRQQENLDKQMEDIKKQKESLMKKTEFLIKQKELLQREINVDIENINAHRRKYASAIIKDHEYKITTYLSGFNEEDIVVKFKKGLLIIEAVHNIPGEPKSNYLDVRELPDFVEGCGKWLYRWGVLKIIFPIMQRQNKYPNSKISTSNEILSTVEIGKPNIVNQKNSATANVTDNIEDSNQVNKIKVIADRNQDDYVEAITDLPIEVDDIKASSYIASQENGHEGNIDGLNQGDVEQTTYAIPANADDISIL